MTIFLIIVGWCCIAVFVARALGRRIKELAREAYDLCTIPVLRDVIEDDE